MTTTPPWVSAAADLLDAGLTGAPGAALSDVDINRIRDTMLVGGTWANRLTSVYATQGARHAGRISDLLSLVESVDSAEPFALLTRQPAAAARALVPAVGYPGKWTVLAELYAAMWRAAADCRVRGVSSRDQQVGAAFLARSHWLLLSLPFRPQTRDLIPAHDLARYDRVDVIASDARAARDTWLGELARIDDLPVLRRCIDPVGEAAAVTRLAVNADCASSAALHRAPTDRPDTTDLAVWRTCVDEFLLPRFAWWSAARVSTRIAPGASRISITAALVILLGGIAAWALPWTILATDRSTQASLSAAGGYVLMVAAGLTEPAVVRPWLLRQPATAVIGLLALAALSPTWWLASTGTDGRSTALVGVALAVVAAGYLLIEARNHGAGTGRRFVGRTTTVILIGLLHAVFVSLIALRWLVPTVADLPDDGTVLQGWWMPASHSGVIAPWALLTFATGWSFAGGVFAQILWDDRPVTAPLAHIRWRKE